VSVSSVVSERQVTGRNYEAGALSRATHTATPTRLNSRVESHRRRRAACVEFTTSSRRVPTDLVEKLKTGHVESS